MDALNQNHCQVDLSQNSHCQVGYAQLQGQRRTMEDRLNIQLNKKKNHSYFAVYDGHGGQQTAIYLQTFLRERIFDLDDFSDHEKIAEVVRAIDREFAEKYPNYIMTGSTCNFVLLNEWPSVGVSGEEKFHLIIANTGDSRALIIDKDGKPRFGTIDHKPFLETERQRITNANGSVCLGRVNGQLAVSRAIGDWCYKNDVDLHIDHQKVIALPDFYDQNIAPGELLVIASDGLFEHTSDEEVAAFIHKKLQTGQKPDLDTIASQLASWSINNNCSGDNISVILVSLQPFLKSEELTDI